MFLSLTVPITTLAPIAGLLLDRLPTRPVLGPRGRGGPGLRAVLGLLFGATSLAMAGCVGMAVRRRTRHRPAPASDG